MTTVVSGRPFRGGPDASGRPGSAKSDRAGFLLDRRELCFMCRTHGHATGACHCQRWLDFPCLAPGNGEAHLRRHVG